MASLFYLTCGLWGLGAVILYGFVFARLMSELKRQRLEHSKGASAAGASVGPLWNDLPSEPTPKHFAGLQNDSDDVKRFFPAFKLDDTVSTDPTDELFDKVSRNLFTTGVLGVIAFGFVTCVSRITT